MENPEEVLQALDEFQKVRPSEIPRELEDYLCWVARTGDPVYQWSLVKSLFREKLVRVMSDFYENCPTLDLAPCPNVEQFNYDTMKRTLIERFESFNNAPFTVQRICELLTTPRKEYNRIDKFMRAIEKNILVVSTREPGPCGKKSENGDGLVNGSVDDEGTHQTSNEVDMDNWVKDCITIVVPQQQQDNTEIKNGVNKTEQLEKMEPHQNATASTFVSDFQTTPQEVATVIPNLNQETTAIVGDVSDAIMNEDTSSQPSLELESEDSNSSDSKKLQTTFEAKDFGTLTDDQSKTHSNDELEVPKSTKPMEPCQINTEAETLVQPEVSSDTIDSEQFVNDSVSENKERESISSEIEPAASITDAPLVSTDQETNVEDKMESSAETEAKSTTGTDSTDKRTVDLEIAQELPATCVEESIEPTSIETPVQVEKSVVEEPIVECIDSASSTTDSSEFTIEEITEEKNCIKTPIIEEQKEKDTSAETAVDDTIGTINNGLSEPFTSIWDEKVEMNPTIVSIEELVCNKPVTESMDIDHEVSTPQDEPMEEEHPIEAMTS